MPIKTVDIAGKAEDHPGGGVRLLNGPNFQAWFNVYPAGRSGRMHCHNADETLCVLEGQLTVHDPDGAKWVLDRGMAALITGGSYYRLENTGDGPLVFMGHNSKPTETMRTVEYDTRKPDGRDRGDSVPPRHTTILV